MTTKTAIARTLYVHVVLKSVIVIAQILYDIVPYARHFLPIKFSTKYYLAKGRQAEPHTHMERKGNPSMNFLMVIMASGIARGCERTTTTTTESRKMTAILQILD